jgi:hypothetical protein
MFIEVAARFRLREDAGPHHIQTVLTRLSSKHSQVTVLETVEASHARLNVDEWASPVETCYVHASVEYFDSGLSERGVVVRARFRVEVPVKSLEPACSCAGFSVQASCFPSIFLSLA